MTRARPITAIAALLASATGCTSHASSYRRARPAAGELVWAYRERFQVTRDSEILAEQHDWDALPGAVTCVPRARDWAACSDAAAHAYAKLYVSRRCAHRDSPPQRMSWATLLP